MIKLSVVIITFNEERNIGRCLDSVKSVADEIVVVDSFSTDKTEVICNSFGARFIQNSFSGYIAQKNFALSQCRYNYILSLDADEALDETLISQISSIKSNWDADAYSFNRLTSHCGKFIHHCGWYPDVKIRLWDCRVGKWGGEDPHDKVILANSARKRHLKGNLIHYSYYTLEEHILQANKFSTIAAREKFSKGASTNLLKIWISIKFRFFKDFYLRLGFLDGFHGYFVCKMNAHEVFLKYSKLYLLQQDSSR
jgi:glycosyltransferase involved in cell wall biosynthesis